MDTVEGIMPIEPAPAVPLYDEFLHPFGRLFEGIADLDAHLADLDAGVAFELDRADVDTPIEVDAVVADDGAVTLTSAPPTQHVETTYMPVFHRVRMTVAVDALG